MDLINEIEGIFKIKTFSQKIYCDIFDIVIKNNEKYSSNKSGIFINLTDCNETTLDQIYKYMIQIEKSSNDHETYINDTEKKLSSLKDSLKKQTVKPVEKKRIYNQPMTKSALKKLEKDDLEQKKPNYSGVYKRIYNNMKGYKNGVKKEVVEKKEDSDEEAEIEPGLEIEVEIEVEEEVVKEIDFEDLEHDSVHEDDDLFGNESE